MDHPSLWTNNHFWGTFAREDVFLSEAANTEPNPENMTAANPKVRSCCEYDSNQIYLVRNLRAVRCAESAVLWFVMY